MNEVSPDIRLCRSPPRMEVAPSPPGLIAGSRFRSYIITSYTTPSYSEPVTCTTSCNAHLITLSPTCTSEDI